MQESRKWHKLILVHSEKKYILKLENSFPSIYIFKLYTYYIDKPSCSTTNYVSPEDRYHKTRKLGKNIFSVNARVKEAAQTN
jgi:hypothetical protein